MAVMTGLLAGCGGDNTALIPQYDIVGNTSLMGNLMTAAGCHRPSPDLPSTARQAVRFPGPDGGVEVFDCTGVSPTRIVDAVNSFGLAGGSLRTNHASLATDPDGGYGSWGLEDAPYGYTWEPVNGTTTISSIHTPGQPWYLDLQNYFLGPDDALLIEIIDTGEIIGEAHSIIIHITKMQLTIDLWDPYWQTHTPPAWCGECGSGADPGGGGGGESLPCMQTDSLQRTDACLVSINKQSSEWRMIMGALDSLTRQPTDTQYRAECDSLKAWTLRAYEAADLPRNAQILFRGGQNSPGHTGMGSVRDSLAHVDGRFFDAVIQGTGANGANARRDLLRYVYHEMAHALGHVDHVIDVNGNPYPPTSAGAAAQIAALGNMRYFRGSKSPNSAAQCVKFNVLNN